MNILGGILETQETTSMAGIPFLSRIPVLKYFFSSTRTEVSQNEVLIVMTPHIVRLPRMTAANLRGIDVGTSSNFRIRTRPATTERAPTVPGSSDALAPPPDEDLPSSGSDLGEESENTGIVISGPRRGAVEGEREALAGQDPGPMTATTASGLPEAVIDEPESLIIRILWSHRPDVPWWEPQAYPGGGW